MYYLNSLYSLDTLGEFSTFSTFSTFFLKKGTEFYSCVVLSAEDELGQLVANWAQATKNLVDFSRNGDVN